MARPLLHKLELATISELRPHPENYRRHPDYQRAHIERSLADHGVYRNVVLARDGTILAGHGVVEAARRSGLEVIPAVRLDLDPDEPRARKLLAGDNEIARLAEVDEQQLADLLQSLGPDEWPGTGFDDGAFAKLLAGLAPLDPEAEWAGMPDYESRDLTSRLRVTVHFPTEADRAAFFALIEREPSRFLWWPESDGHVGASGINEETYIDRGAS